MTRKFSVFATLVMLSLSVVSSAVELVYPELHVVPSAEERLNNAAKSESGYFMRNWQLLAPATFLTLSGISLQGDIQVDEFRPNRQEIEDRVKGMATLQIGVGLGIAGLSYYWHSQNYYAAELARIQSLPKASKKDQLARARYAEEALLKQYKLMRKMKWLIAGLTLGLSQAERDYAGEDAKLAATLAGVSALLPLFFEHDFETNYKNYDRSKNRVFGPVVRSGLIPAPNAGLAPGLQLAMQF